MLLNKIKKITHYSNLNVFIYIFYILYISLLFDEVISTESLNQKSEWNLDYFNRLRLAISIQKNEFKYAFIDIKEEPSNKMVFFIKNIK